MTRHARRAWPRLLPLALLASSTDLSAQTPRPRQVAAPPSDILSGLVRLPEPGSAPFVSRAAMLPLRFRREAGAGWSATVELPVERSGDLSLALLSPDAGTWKLLARAPGTALRQVGEIPATDRRLGPVGDLPGWVLDRYDLAGARAGAWVLRIEAEDPSGARPPAEGWLLATSDRELEAAAYATTLELVAGNTIGIAARAGAGVASARLLLESAVGVSELAMADDGLHEDGAAGDGLFGAILPASLQGDVRARVELRGTTESGSPFLRSVPMTFPVLERAVALAGRARAETLDENRCAIAIEAFPLLPQPPLLPAGPPSRLHVSAEVWGRDASGANIPVCWLSRITEHAPDGALPLVLDARWLALAGARAPLELREVRVQDVATEVVFDRVRRMPLEIASLPPGARIPPRGITQEMLTGGSSFASTSALPGLPPSGHPIAGYSPALVLVHGYCSGGSIWPAADFTQPKLEFLDPNANRTHDEFAQRIFQQAQAAGLTSFGVVAHSQGGCAALHLLTYYESGLDHARGGRRIQSVASPYQGTPLAEFGEFACGDNTDMTPPGSATWLSGIPSWARAEVSYWTTSNSGSVCSSFTDFLLADPEDGTVEMTRGQLPGAQSMGHVTGWCHTTGMSNPANYTDHARNQAMNAAAAR